MNSLQFLVDSHAHIDDEAFDQDREKVIDRALKADVKVIVSSSLGVESSIKTLKLAELYKPLIYPTLGMDPCTLDEGEIEGLIKLIIQNKSKIVGIGEVGLDYYYVRREEERRIQERNFVTFINLAKELEMPLIIHSRSAGKYAVKILEREKAQKVLLHAFDGRLSWALKASSLSYHLSIPTSIHFSTQKQLLARHITLEKLLIESDAPVLSPIRGERNEPANLIYAVRKIAELKGIAVKEVIKRTTQNSLNFYNIPLK